MGNPVIAPLPRAAGNAAGAAQRSPCARCERQKQSPSRRLAGSPGTRPYLWPTSLPTEPPPRAGSKGLRPCGSSGAEAPAGAPPGPALPSDGERGSLARAILRERTGGRRRGRRSHLRAPPRAPRAAAAVDRPGGAGGGRREAVGGGRPDARGSPGGRGLSAQGPAPPCNGSSSKNHDSHGVAGGGEQ